MFSGVLPTILFASEPMARIFLFVLSRATTEGSSIMMPFPFRYISVFDVPKSIPIPLTAKLFIRL